MVENLLCLPPEMQLCFLHEFGVMGESGKPTPFFAKSIATWWFFECISRSRSPTPRFNSSKVTKKMHGQKTQGSTGCQVHRGVEELFGMALEGFQLSLTMEDGPWLNEDVRWLDEYHPKMEHEMHNIYINASFIENPNCQYPIFS